MDNFAPADLGGLAARSWGALLLAFGLAAGLTALPIVWLWGFTVDDALIPARVAVNITNGAGYRFNASGPVVDAVTPIGWAHVLALSLPDEPLDALRFAKWAGALACVAAGGWLGVLVARAGSRAIRFAPLTVLAVSAPFAGWAVAGMETGLVTAAATAALSRTFAAALFAGLAAAWRPELLPWAAALAVSTAVGERQRPARVLAALGAAAGPALAVALVRTLVFGRPAPLAALAKPPEFDHGLFYAAGCLLWSGATLLPLSLQGLRALDGHGRAVLVAVLVHLVILFGVGGDWMPLFRLFVPVIPGLVYVGAAIAEHTAPWTTWVRVGAAVTVSTVLFVDAGRTARAVGDHREHLRRDAVPLLRGANRVATLDVGWVGAATSATVVDLAGVTDERVAVLSGGHTTKRLPEGFCEQREIDALVLLLAPGARSAEPWWEAAFARGVEYRIANDCRSLGFKLKGILPLGGTDQRYLVLRLQAAP